MTNDERLKFENTVLYLLHHSPGRPGVTQLLKMLYFADYHHYRQFLSTITGADYVALPNGPVVDGYKEIFEDLVDRHILDWREVPVYGGRDPKIEYAPLFEPDMSVFTATELQVLDTVIERYGNATGAALSQQTHREGPWVFAWDPTNPGQPIPPILFRWLDNVPDDADIERARARLDRGDMRAVIESLNQASAQPAMPN